MFERVKAHRGLRKYGSNTIWLFAEKAVRILIGFTVGIYVTRRLGPELFGVLNYALSFVDIFSVLAGLGLDVVLVRELVKRPDDRDRLMGTAFGLKLAGFIIMLTGIGVGLFFSGNDVQINVVIGIIAGGYLFQTIQVIDFYFQAEVKSRYIAISQMIAIIIWSGCRAYLALVQAPLVYFAATEVIFMLVSGLGYTWFYLRLGKRLKDWIFSRQEALLLLHDCWPLIVCGAASMIYLRIDQIILKSMLGAEEVGFYAVAIRLVELTYFIPVVVSASFFPAIVTGANISRGIYYYRFKLLMGIMFWSAMIISFTVWFSAEWIILLLYGSRYEESGPLLQILIWRTVLVAIGMFIGKWYIIENLQHYNIFFTVGACLLNILLNICLIRTMGVTGAAWASLITAFCSLFIFSQLFKKTRYGNILIFQAIRGRF